MNTQDTQYKGFTIQHPAAANERFHVLGEGFNPEGYASVNAAKGAITKAINTANASTGTTEAAASKDPVQQAIAEAEAKGQDPYLAGMAARSEQREKAASNNDADKASVPATPIAGNPELDVKTAGTAHIQPDGYKLTHDAPADVTQLSAPVPTVFANLIAGDRFTSMQHPGYTLVKTGVNMATVPGTSSSYEFHSDAVVCLTHFAKVYPEMKVEALAALLKYYGMGKKRDTRSRNKREGGYAGKWSIATILDKAPAMTPMHSGHNRKGERKTKLQTLKERSKAK